MKICEWYKLCLTMQPKTSVRVLYNGHPVYTGNYGDMPYHISHLDFVTCVVTPMLEWKFYVAHFVMPRLDKTT